ncbi:MAG TPA: tail fiber domain-containing protein, partial [Bacteroidia bacterium]|nr:tail fiber domain-containing protein [Bacteroidia bacterium]
SASLYNQQTGNYNTALGFYALNSPFGVTSFSYNTAVGYQAAFFNTTGGNNTALGAAALLGNETGSFNTAVGMDAMQDGPNANACNNNTAVGYQSLEDCGSTGASNNNTCVGYQSLYYNGLNAANSNNTALGYQTGYNNGDGTVGGANNTLIGYLAGYGANGSGYSLNTFVGSQSGYDITTGTNNTANGASALFSLKAGTYNTAMGYDADLGSSGLNYTTMVGALAYVSSSNATAIGYNANQATWGGPSSTAVGYSSQAGTNATALGATSTATGSNSTALGNAASDGGFTNATALGNGATATNSNTIQLGNNSVVMTNTAGQISVGGAGVGGQQGFVWGGGLAGPTNFCGISCNCYPTTNAATWTQTAAAYGATFQFVNDGFSILQTTTATVGVNGVHVPSLPALIIQSAIGGPNAGKVGINKGAPGFQLDVNGTTACTGNVWTSDARKKKDIETLDLNALDIIGKLHPVTFEWKNVIDDGMKGMQMGFIAQELEKTVPTMVVTSNDSMQSKSVKYT